MEASKQESVSRQSSILKAPKQRQPLQCVAMNPTSSESSPTIKIKRRVSFAKNKRIREFCNEVEPKEGLDDSYEEHDLSNTKSSNGNSTDHPLVISVACEDKENFPIQLFLPTDQIDQIECKEIQAASFCGEENNLSQCVMEMNNSINTEMQNKEMTLPDSTIYFDDGMDITASIQPQIISTHVQQGESHNDTLPVSQTYIEDESMEMTETLQSILSKKIVHLQNKNHNVNFENNSANFTEPVSTILGIGNAKKLIESQITKPLSRNCENETECFTDIPLEFTSVIPSSTWIQPHNQSQNNDETNRFNCNTMEITEAVQLCNIIYKNKTEEVDETSGKNIDLLAQKDNKVSNTSIEQFQDNEFYQEKNNILFNNSKVTTAASSNQDVINQISNINHILLEKTNNIFSNASMEITEAVSVNNEIKILPVSMKETEQEKAQEKTKIFCDQSMELTNVPNSKLLHIERSEKGRSQSNEKIFFKDTTMEMTEVIASHNKIEQQASFKNKVLQQETNKTKVFFDTSMEITEAVPVCHKNNCPIEMVEKTHPENLQDRTKHFNDNSMEITEALGFNNIEKSSPQRNELITQGNKKTQLLVNISREITENLPMSNNVNKTILKKNKSYHEIAEDRTKLFHDKSMEVTEAAIHYNKIQLLSKLDNEILESMQEKTKFFFNASMEMSEGVPAILGKINQPITDLINIHENCNNSMEITEAIPVYHHVNQCTADKAKYQQETTKDRTNIFQNKSMKVTEIVLNYNKSNSLSSSKYQLAEPGQEQTKFFLNASMEITEAAPLVNRNHQPEPELKNVFSRNMPEQIEIFEDKSMEITEAVNVHSNNNVSQCAIDKVKNQQEIAEDRTKIFQNKSMEVTETVHNYNKFNSPSNSKNQLTEPGQKQTKFFLNASMEITEAAPLVNRNHQSEPELKNVFSRNMPEQTVIFQNKSMEMTEAVNLHSNNYHQEKTKIFQNMSVTETTPVNKEIWQCNIGNSAAVSKQSKEVSINNRIMKQIDNLNENLRIGATITDNQTISLLRDEKAKYFDNKSMIKILPGFEHQNALSCTQNKVPILMTDKTKDFYNNSINITEAIIKNQNSFGTNSSILSNSIKDLQRLHQHDMSNKMDIENSNHLNSKKNVFNISTNYRDKSFQRMTTDELNILCASMNLPTQNYTTERNSTMQNDFISVCNDVNVLRDSLQKNTIFQQNFTIGTNINIPIDNNMQISNNVDEKTQKQDDLQMYCNTNGNSVDKSVTPHKEQSEILPTGINYRKEYNTIDQHIFKEGNFEFSEIQSPALGTRNSKDENMLGISSQSLKNVSSTDAEYSNFILNEKQTCETQSNNHSLAKNQMLQIHNISTNSSSIPKSTAKRKSAQLDVDNEIAENSLKRLPSDSTELLIATSGCRTELSHPPIINDRTSLKIPCVPRILSSCSNKIIQYKEDFIRNHEKNFKNITSFTIENEVFDEVCNYSNKKNEENPENKEFSIQTELLSHNSMNQLDEIQPPSFLCSDSFQTDSIVDTEVLDNKSSDVISSEIIQEKTKAIYEKEYFKQKSDMSNSQNSSIIETRQSFTKDFSPSNSIERVDTSRHFNEENRVLVGKSSFFNNSEELDDSMISLINEEDVNTDPLTPFLLLTKSIEACEKRDDCIWTIRKIDQKTVAVDFISKSFVAIIRLNEIQKACTKDIDNIEFISRLHSGSKNILLKIVHRLLLSKLKPDKLLSEYKIYEDVLPLLDYISKEVILAMNFMFDIERLSALNLLSVDNERVLFMVSSKKANIILEISLVLKVFNEIGPDDISVTCVLGDVRVKDIKQLIINIKKDSTFLSRYINDVKDYIMIIEESTRLQR